MPGQAGFSCSVIMCHWRRTENSSWLYPWRKHVSLLERPELINKWCPCLFQSTTQKEELPWYVLEDSTQHNTVYILPHSSVYIPCLLKLDTFIGFQAVFQAPRQAFGKISETTAFVPMPFGSLSCDSGSIRSCSQTTTKSRDRGFFFFFLATLTPNPISQWHAAVPK